MMKKKEATAEQYKIELKVFDSKGNRVEGEDLKHYNEEESMLRDGEELIGSKLSRRKVRGPVLDYRITLEQIIGLPSDPQKGANYVEMMQVKPIMEKLKDAESGGDILLDSGDFKTLKTRVTEHRYPQISEAIWDFIESIEKSVKVPVVEQKKVELISEGLTLRSS